MKTILSIVLSLNLLGAVSTPINGELNNGNTDTGLVLNSQSALLLDYNSGEVLYEKNSNDKLKPASMTKMMGLYLVMESLENEVIKLEDKVQCSLEASQIGGSQIYLKENEEMSIDDLIKSVCIASANDAMYLLGEVVGGSNDSFVSMMNDKCKEFELTNTNFTNVMGFDDDNHYSCSFDMGVIAYNLLKDYGDLILKYSSMTESYLREDTSNPFWLVNTNKLLGDYEGMDGLKTGYTHEAGYCLTATSKKDNLRLIAVTMNASTIKERSNDIKSLLNYGYRNFKSVKVFSKNDLLLKVEFKNSKNDLDNVYIKEDIYITLPIKESNDSFEYTYTLEKDSAPLLVNERVGTIEIYNSMGMQFNGELIVGEEVERINWFEYFWIIFRTMFA